MHWKKNHYSFKRGFTYHLGNQRFEVSMAQTNLFQAYTEPGKQKMLRILPDTTNTTSNASKIFFHLELGGYNVQDDITEY